MNDHSKSSGAGVLIGLVLVILLLVGGAGVFLVMERRQAVAAAVLERARAEAAAEVATRQAEIARADDAGDEVGDARLGVDEQPSTTDSGAVVRAAVESVMRDSQDAWNRGDVDAFVEHYWKSEDVTFSSGGTTTRGWVATARRYREKYPTREAMGRLTFSNLEITPLGGESALVLGEWALERDEPASGNFTLVLRKLDGRWVIVHDHTSRAEE